MGSLWTADCGGTIAADQRGVVRPQNGACDLGAAEIDASVPVSPALSLMLVGHELHFAWSTAAPLCDYDLYRSDLPYSGYGLWVEDLGDFVYTAVENGSEGMLFYAVQATCSTGVADSPAMGRFTFGLTAGE